MRKILLLVVCTLLFAGCSSNNVVYETEQEKGDNTALTTGYEPDSLRQFSDIDVCREDLGVPCDAYTNYKIEAKLTLPNAEHMSLFEEKTALEEDKSWIELCDAMFDTYEKNDELSPIDYLAHSEEKKFVPQKQYVGSRDGIKYLIGKYEREYQGDTMRVLLFQPVDIIDVMSIKADDVSDICIGYDETADVDDCSNEQKKSDEFMKISGMNEFKVSQVCRLGWYEDMGQDVEPRLLADDGYIFTYSMQCNDSLAVSDGDSYELDDSLLSEKEGLYHVPTIDIAVNDKGVIWVRMLNPLQSKKTMTKVSLLSIDKVLAALKVQLKDNPQLLNSSVITGATLEYVCVPGENLEFSIVPAWKFETHDSKIYINAVDGSLIVY